MTISTLTTTLVLGTLAGYSICTQDGNARQTPTQAELARLATAGENGSEHSRLAALSGSWVVERREWKNPTQPKPAIVEAKCNNSWMLGGRYIKMSTMWKVGKRPMQSISIIGCDRRDGTYTMTSLDSETTWQSNARGRWIGSKRNIVLDAKDTHPTTQQTVKTSYVIDLSTKNTWKLTVYKALSQGSGAVTQRYKALEVIGKQRVTSATSGR